MWTRWFFLFLFALCVVLCVTPAQAHEQSQPPSMMLSIKNTFYHVCEPLVARKRTQSAPPEVFVGRCIAHALMRERMRERSKARKRNQLTKHAAKKMPMMMHCSNLNGWQSWSGGNVYIHNASTTTGSTHWHWYPER